MVWQSWRSAWQHALYGPTGFYRQSVGPAGHFATSAQGIPGGGSYLASAVAILAERAGCSAVLDVGAGRGELLAELATVAPGLRLTGVDVVERPEDLPPAARWVESPGGAELPDELRGIQETLVLAHEWLDVVPCAIAEYDGSVWREVQVKPHDVSPPLRSPRSFAGAPDLTHQHSTSEWEERLGIPVEGADLQWLQANWPIDDPTPGDRVEIGTSRDAAYSRLRERIESGLFVAVDYGHLRDHRPHGGTLTGYRDGVQCPAVPDGSTDVTAHVAMDTLGAAELVQQRELFERLELKPDGPPMTLAREDPPAYLQQLAAVGSYAQLTAHGGLGDFWWAISPVGR